MEPVEGGLTRLLAIFSRDQAREVGPVRSGRETDVTILAQLGEGRLRLLRLVVLHRQGAGPRGAGEPQQRPVGPRLPTRPPAAGAVQPHR
ncbi:DUF3048 domain-containing protein [Phycicoccus sp. Soil748]|uniref:DUF3048 domain-containing protein n=1 Tax=Phycicoccus sp. Soil748 TaxID=1736397 RepID=UPI00138F7C22